MSAGRSDEPIVPDCWFRERLSLGALFVSGPIAWQQVALAVKLRRQAAAAVAVRDNDPEDIQLAMEVKQPLLLEVGPAV
jgi:hypothetical protein